MGARETLPAEVLRGAIAVLGVIDADLRAARDGERQALVAHACERQEKHNVAAELRAVRAENERLREAARYYMGGWNNYDGDTWKRLRAALGENASPR